LNSGQPATGNRQPVMQLSIVTLGHVHEQDIAALTPHFTRIEQLVLDVPPHEPLAKHRAEFNRAVDASTNDWLLIMREPETVDETLAAEISSAITASNAWGFRIRTLPLYAGKPLRLRLDEGEIRLFHRRHYLRREEETSIQGTVVRVHHPFQAVTFASADAHREYLARTATPRATARRALVFLRDAIATRATDANTLRYIWTEAGFDKA
jgi:hypothetical protein